jgi:ElaB/YqjD/DUF883 family membrane-anchored ribosome-binding protein
MAKDQIDKLEQKKQELENELHQIQGELDNSIDEVRDEVSSNLDPKTLIRKYPLTVVGASALVGFLLGNKGRRKSSSKSSSGEFSGALLAELKRLATKKAVSFATDYVEEVLDKKAREHLSTTNGEEEQ